MAFSCAIAQSVSFSSLKQSANSSAPRRSGDRSLFAISSGKSSSESSYQSTSSSQYFGTPLPNAVPLKSVRSAPKMTVQAIAYPKSVLIVNTNSGGHAIIGFWLARELAKDGHEVTILTVGEESSDKMKKPPFSRFSELRSLGVNTIWGDPSDIASIVGFKIFNVVIDNNGKNLEAVKPVVDWARAWRANQFIFVSSAGIYKTNDQPPYVEGDPVKGDSGHALVEDYLKLQFPGKWSSFRPQYIIGDGNNKDCEEWFFDRIVRGRPVPIPAPGLQTTVISHVADLASMLKSAVEKPESATGIFNAVGDRVVTFDGLVRMCARAAGKEARIVHYDPAAVGVDAKKAFPFRNQHFYSEPRAAKVKLGWESSVNLQDALNERFKDYLSIGRDRKAISFDLDDKILDALSVKA